MNKRTTISISEDIYALALKVMEARLQEDFSGLVQILIREEYERRGGILRIENAPTKKTRGKPKRKGNPGRYENAGGATV